MMNMINKFLKVMLLISGLWIFAVHPGFSQDKALDSNPDSSALTLEQCIKIALENNPVIGYKNWEIKALDARKNEEISQRWPSVFGAGSYHHYSDTLRLAPPRGFSYPVVYTDDILSLNLVLTMPVFEGGRITNQIKAAELFLQSAEYSLVYTRQELIFKVTSIYFSILKQHQLIKSLDFSRTALEKHLIRVKELVAAKKAAKLDQLRVEVRLADIVQRIETQKNTLAIQNRTLANLMGMEKLDFWIPPKKELEFQEMKIDLEEKINQAYINRADYQSAQKEVEAQAKQVRAVYADYWPSVSLYASYGVQTAIGSFISLPGIDGIEDIGQVGFLLQLPLFEGGKAKANLHHATASLALLNEKLRELELRIRLEVEAAVFNLRSTGKRITATEKALEQANESLRIELEKYNLGKGSITDIFDAESALLDIQTIYYSALADFRIYSAQLEFVQGRT